MGSSLSFINDNGAGNNSSAVNSSSEISGTNLDSTGRSYPRILDTSSQPSQGLGNNSPIESVNNISDSNDLTRQSASLNTTSVNNDPSNFIVGATSSNETTSSLSFSDDFKFNWFGTNVYPFRWLTLPTLHSWLRPLSSLAMIIGCVLPYVPQYMTIYKNQSCSGFSTFVCLTLLLANILRVAFWFGHNFELPLLIQSGLMILAQIFLLELCVRVKRRHSVCSERSFFQCDLRYFWRWTHLTSYVEFLCVFTAIVGTAMYIFIEYKPFVETIGYCSVVMESMLGLPQVIKNCRKRSVVGMSLSMVLMWLAGDTFKTGYFISNEVPYQFWLCGLLQITIDLLILFQVCLFRQNAPIKLSSRAYNWAKETMAL